MYPELRLKVDRVFSRVHYWCLFQTPSQQKYSRLLKVVTALVKAYGGLNARPSVQLACCAVRSEGPRAHGDPPIRDWGPGRPAVSVVWPGHSDPAHCTRVFAPGSACWPSAHSQVLGIPSRHLWGVLICLSRDSSAIFEEE